jgi:hypothetical protein
LHALAVAAEAKPAASPWLHLANSSLTLVLLAVLALLLVLLTVAVWRVGASVCHELSQLTLAIREAAPMRCAYPGGASSAMGGGGGVLP